MKMKLDTRLLNSQKGVKNNKLLGLKFVSHIECFGPTNVELTIRNIVVGLKITVDLIHIAANIFRISGSDHS